MKTTKLIGSDLDMAVAKLEGVRAWFAGEPGKSIVHWYDDERPRIWAPSTDPAQAWPIMEREGIIAFKGPYGLGEASQSLSTLYHGVDDTIAQNEPCFTAPTALIAAMRLYVHIKLGAEVTL